MNRILYTSNLTKDYGKSRIIDSVSMNIQRGEIYGFVGRNGAGKSTTMRMLCGLARPTAGEIIMNREYLPDYSKIGSLIESPGLYYNMTAMENLSYKAMLLGCNKTDSLKELLRSVGLNHTLRTKVKDYSLGMRQRLGIAMALIGNPNLLILDEPINGLDPQGIAEVRDILIDLNQKGITIMISSHILTELYKLASGYGFISHGKLVLEISKEALDKECAGKCSIEVADCKKSAALLSKSGIAFTDKDNFIVLNHPEDRTKAITTLAQNGISIINVTTDEISLEEFYFSICKE